MEANNDLLGSDMMTYRHQCVAARGSHTCDGALDERSPELGGLDTCLGPQPKVTVVLSIVLDSVPRPPSPNPHSYRPQMAPNQP